MPGRFPTAGICHRVRLRRHNLLPDELIFIQTIHPFFLNHLIIHPGKHGGPIVVIPLRPAIERMIVALGALEPNAKKYLRGVLGPDHWRAVGPIKIGRRITVGAPTSSDNVRSKFI